jgi:hypothetical protein
MPHQDLSGSGQAAQTGGEVQCSSSETAVYRDRLPGVHTDPDRQRTHPFERRVV